MFWWRKLMFSCGCLKYFFVDFYNVKHKELLLVMIFSCVASHTFAQFVRDLYTNEIINGRVESITNIEYIRRLTGAVDTSIYVDRYNFKGELTEIDVSTVYDGYFPMDIPRKSTKNSRIFFKYHYLENGKLSAITCRGDTGNEITAAKLAGIIKYNSKGQIQYSVNRNRDGSWQKKFFFRYGNNGHLLKIILYDDPIKGDILTSYYKYDKNNLVTEESHYSNGDTKKSPYRNVFFKFKAFDEKNNWTKRIGVDTVTHRSYMKDRHIIYVQ
jgi:hypothetical protein